MPVAEPIRSKSQVRELSEYYLKRGEPRNHFLIILGFHTALRISDILRLTWNDVYDFERRRVRSALTITERKTQKSKTIAINASLAAALKRGAGTARPETPLIVNKRTGRAISRVQAYRLIRKAAERLSFQSRVSCHSLRKTFGYHAWKAGISPAVIMEIYNHSSFAVTRRYLGVTQDDKNAAYLSPLFTP